jgi:Ca2+-binding RTX toxin-like protein
MRGRTNANVFEQLESRQLMSAGIYEPLVINGTDTADSIVLDTDGNFVKVTNNGVTTTHRWKAQYMPGSTPTSGTWLPGISKIVINGKGGDDTLNAANGPVKVEIYGGSGRDTITGSKFDDMLVGPEQRPANGSTVSTSENFSDLITGGAGNDLIHSAMRGGSSLAGDAGNDTIWGSEYADQINAGTGDDNVQALKGNDNVRLGPDQAPTYLTPDNDKTDTAEGSDTVYGGYGNDMIIAGTHSDSLVGGTGNDTFACDSGNDTIYAGDGNDKIYAGEGNDKAFAGYGNDTLVGLAGNDTLLGDAGDDSVEGGLGNDSLFGGDGFDEVSYFAYGQPVTVSLSGNSGNGAPGENDFVAATFEAIRGGSKNDILTGNASNNAIFGDLGDDIIRTGAGNDTVDAGFGDDRVWGEDGNDKLDGTWGKDELFGGRGNDTLVGGYDDDRLISLGGGVDEVEGKTGRDLFVAGNEDNVKDYKPAEKDTLHKISYFSNFVSTELDGQNLPDPSLSGMNAHYDKRFNNIPLFHKPGPQTEDVIQGSIGDCYFVSGLAAIAHSPKDGIIERNIVDLGDGSYMVKFFDDATPKWFRVDNQLPIKNKTFDEVAFAKTRSGADASMWVPIYEKAFAIHRTGVAKYEEIVGDNDWTDPGMPYETYGAFGLWHDTDEVIFNDLETYMQKMRNFLQAGGAVTASTDPPWLGCDITPFHVYTVLNVSADLKHVTIRNPWARDDTAFASGPNDGVITISAEQFDDDFFFVSYSNL